MDFILARGMLDVIFLFGVAPVRVELVDFARDIAAPVEIISLPKVDPKRYVRLVQARPQHHAKPPTNFINVGEATLAEQTHDQVAVVKHVTPCLVARSGFIPQALHFARL